MLKNNVILFLVDHKHRDLPSASYIGHFLIKKGYNVKYCSYWKEDNIINELNPKYIILGKPVYSYSTLSKWRAEGRRWIALDVEGNPQDIKYKMKVDIFPDLAIYWNQEEAEGYKNIYFKTRNIFNIRIPHIKILGCPRIDFHHPSLKHLFIRKSLYLNSLGLSNKLKTVTIATSTQDSHFSNQRRVTQKKRRDELLLESTGNYDMIVENMRLLRNETEELIELLSEIDNVNLIIKPHPNENVLYWDNLIKSYGNPRIKVMKGEAINQLLSISDLHISHNVCTTTFEALIHGIPTIELQTKLSKKLYKTEHLKLSDNVVFSAEEALPIVIEKLKNTHMGVETETEKVNRYCEKYYGVFDGNRCKDYAEAIHNFIDNCAPFSRLDILLNQIQRLRYILIDCYYSIKTLLKRIFKSSTPLNEDDLELAANKIDERGRFDNRIIPGDENYWLKRFN